MSIKAISSKTLLMPEYIIFLTVNTEFRELYRGNTQKIKGFNKKKLSFCYETYKILCFPVKSKKWCIGNFTTQDIINYIIVPRYVTFYVFPSDFIKLYIAKIYLSKAHVSHKHLIAL